MNVIPAIMAFLAAVSPGAPSTHSIPDEAIAGLKQAKQLVRTQGDRVWPGIKRAPFGFLFITAHGEILLCDDRLPDGFVRAAHNPALDCETANGPQTWRQSSFLAAMPAFGPPSVIVMGSPADTRQSVDAWTLTIIHEHFHQWQSDQPAYYHKVEALGLDGGDQTGMWMLNYRFPYSDEIVAERFKVASYALLSAISARSASDLRAKTADYLKARAALRLAVSANDWRYFEFQLWQEGVARWTEIKIGSLSEAPGFLTASTTKRGDVLKGLRSPDLKTDGRTAVYAFGAGEAFLLDRINRNWRQCYNTQLALGPLFEAKCVKGRLIK